MKRTIAVAATVGGLGIVGGIGATVSHGAGADTDTGCWYEYNVKGTRYRKTVAPIDVSPEDCTPGAGCFFNYRASDGRKVGWLIPHGQDPAVACRPEEPTTTTTTAPPVAGAGSAPWMSANRFRTPSRASLWSGR